MRLHRFYTTQKLASQTHIEISEERIVHQVKNVFRLDAGDLIILFNGDGKEYECQIVDRIKKNISLQILSEKEVKKSGKEIILFMSVIKKENFELACEKVTELGVTKIIPVITERTLKKNLNRERIEKILIEASEQCGRGNVPIFGDELHLEDVLEEENLLVCNMEGESLKDLEVDHAKILIGPEGGWTDPEIISFDRKNIRTVSLGETVLRAETAAIVATALCTL